MFPNYTNFDFNELPLNFFFVVSKIVSRVDSRPIFFYFGFFSQNQGQPQNHIPFIFIWLPLRGKSLLTCLLPPYIYSVYTNPLILRIRIYLDKYKLAVSRKKWHKMDCSPSFSICYFIIIQLHSVILYVSWFEFHVILIWPIPFLIWVSVFFYLFLLHITLSFTLTWEVVM